MVFQKRIALTLGIGISLVSAPVSAEQTDINVGLGVSTGASSPDFRLQLKGIDSAKHVAGGMYLDRNLSIDRRLEAGAMLGIGFEGAISPSVRYVWVPAMVFAGGGKAGADHYYGALGLASSTDVEACSTHLRYEPQVCAAVGAAGRLSLVLENELSATASLSVASRSHSQVRWKAGVEAAATTTNIPGENDRQSGIRALGVIGIRAE